MKKSLFIKLSLPILFFFVILSSCMLNNTKTTPNNQNILSTNQNKKTFNTKSLPTKPNEDFRIQVLEKSEDIPITITNKFKRPLVSTISHNYFDFSPQIRTKKFHKAFTAQEIKQKRREARSKWREWHKDRKKKLKQELKEQHKNQRLYQREVISMMLSLEEKNSPEYKALLKEQIDLRKELLQGQKNERKELKEQYKLEIEEFKNALNENYPKENNKLYIPQDIEPCDIENPTCNVFDYIAFPNDPNPDKDYEYVEENDPTAYTYDNTYVDGKAYTDTYTNSNGEIYKPKLVSNEAFKTSSLKLFSVKSNNKKSFNVKNTTNCTAVEISNEIEGDSVILNIKMNNPTNSCDTLGTFELKITRDNSIDDVCNNFNDISISTSKMMSFKVKIPLSFVSQGSIVSTSFKNASGEYISSDYSYVYNHVGSVKINYVKRDLSIDPSESSSAYKNVYEIENSTNDYLNFTLENSGHEIKMSGSCLGMSKGLISIDKSQLRTDDYVLKIYRSSSNSSDPVAQQIVPITNVQATTFISKYQNIQAVDAQLRKTYTSPNGVFQGSNIIDFIKIDDNVPNIKKNISSINSSSCLFNSYVNDLSTNMIKGDSRIVSDDNLNRFTNFMSDISNNFDDKLSYKSLKNCELNDYYIGVLLDATPDNGVSHYTSPYKPVNDTLFREEYVPYHVKLSFIDKNTNYMLASYNISDFYFTSRFFKSFLIIPLNNLNIYELSSQKLNTFKDISKNKDLIIKVEPDFKFYALNDNGSENYNWFINQWFSNLFGINPNFFRSPLYENMPYVSNENVSRVFINGCTNVIENPTPSIVPLPSSYVDCSNSNNCNISLETTSNIFSPNNDGFEDNIKLKINAPKGTYWNVSIKSDKLMEYQQDLNLSSDDLRKDFSGTSDGNEKIIEWDGKSNTGYLLADLSYNAQLSTKLGIVSRIIEIKKSNKFQLYFGDPSFSTNSIFGDEFKKYNQDFNTIPIKIWNDSDIYSNTVSIQKLRFKYNVQDITSSFSKNIFSRNITKDMSSGYYIPSVSVVENNSNYGNETFSSIYRTGDIYTSPIIVRNSYELLWNGKTNAGTKLGVGKYKISDAECGFTTNGKQVEVLTKIFDEEKFEILEKEPESNEEYLVNENIPLNERVPVRVGENDSTPVIGTINFANPEVYRVIEYSKDIRNLDELQNEYGGVVDSNWFKISFNARVRKYESNINIYGNIKGAECELAEIHCYRYKRKDGKYFYTRVKVKNWLSEKSNISTYSCVKLN